METSHLEISKQDLESWYDKSDKISCNICRNVFSSAARLNLHRVKVHRIIKSSIDESIFHRKKSLLKCIYHCPFIECKYRKLENALESSVGFKFRRDLQQHYDKAHRQKNLICRFCKLSRFSLERLRRSHETRCSGRTSLTSAVPVDVIETACPLSSCAPCSPPSKRKKGSTAETTRSSSATKFLVIRQPIIYCLNPSKNSEKSTREVECQTYFSSECSQCTQTTGDEHEACISDRIVRDYDDMACQTVRTETYGAAVQYSAPQSHIFCQTVNPMTQDVSVITDFDHFFDDSSDQLVSRKDVNLGNTSIFRKDNHDYSSSVENRIFEHELLSISPVASLSLSSDRGDLEDESSLLTWCDSHTQTINYAPLFEQQSTETQTYLAESSLFSTVETQTL